MAECGICGYDETAEGHQSSPHCFDPVEPPRRGRPPKSSAERLSQVVGVRFRVPDPAYDALCLEAARRRKSVREVAREILMDGLFRDKSLTANP